MKITKNQALVGLVFLALAAAVMLGLQAVGMGTPVEEAAPAEWAAQEQLATPLPTLAFDEEPSRPGALLAVGIMVVCTMAGLLVVGVFAAIWMVRLREKILKR